MKTNRTKLQAVAPKTAKTEASQDSELRKITIEGKEYTLDFGLNALCDAEQAFQREGKRVNLLFSLAISTLNLSRLRDLFAAAVRSHHPELGYEGAIALVTPATVYDVANVAYSALMPESEPATAVPSDLEPDPEPVTA